MSVVTGVTILTLCIALVVISYGLLKGKGLAWTVTVVLSCIGIALGLVSVTTGHLGGIFNILINAFISITSIDLMLSHFSVRLQQLQQQILHL
jgi:hypothetical protein